jgi:hypothetical protein
MFQNNRTIANCPCSFLFKRVRTPGRGVAERAAIAASRNVRWAGAY